MRRGSNWTNETSVGVEAYAYDTLQATHVMWDIHGTYGNNYNGSGLTDVNWVDLVAALQAVNCRLHAACPTAYSGGCDAN